MFERQIMMLLSNQSMELYGKEWVENYELDENYLVELVDGNESNVTWSPK